MRVIPITNKPSPLASVLLNRPEDLRARTTSQTAPLDGLSIYLGNVANTASSNEGSKAPSGSIVDAGLNHYATHQMSE